MMIPSIQYSFIIFLKQTTSYLEIASDILTKVSRENERFKVAISYKNKAKEIIEFGISFNNRVLKLLSTNYQYKMSNLGTRGDGRFGFYGNFVHVGVSSVGNEEIDVLLKELPKLNSGVK